jgi:hypothetical protein
VNLLVYCVRFFVSACDPSVSRKDVVDAARAWLASKEDVPAIIVAALDAMNIEDEVDFEDEAEEQE